MEECLYNDWFDANVVDSPEHPAGFMDWTQNITQYKYDINLPDGSKTDARLFMDLQKRFDDNEFTKYLVHRYEELQGLV